MQNLYLQREPYQSFRLGLRKLLDKLVVPQALKWEQSGVFPDFLLKQLGDKKLLGLSIPKKDGGQGRDFWYEVILAEELAKSGLLGWSLSVLVQTNMVAPLISELATPKQKGEILKPALKGQFYLGLAATEPVSGSDLVSVETTAVQEGKFYRLNGYKRYITNGSKSKYLITTVKTQQSKDVWSLGLFLVPTNLKGVVSKRLKTVGFKSGDTAEVEFRNVKLPENYLLGKLNKGFYYLLKGLQRERLVGAVAVNAISEFVLDETIKHLKNKHRYNEALSKKQVIRHKIVDLKSRVESCKHFCYAVCEAYGKGEPIDKEILMLKILCYETAQDVIKECVHLHGAEAFLDSHWISHINSDSQAFTLAAGTSEIMKDLLAGLMQL